MKDRTDLETDLHPLVVTLKKEAITTPCAHVIVYCRSLDMCADLYAHFHFELGEGSYYPQGAPQLSEHRLFGMFHASTPQHNKDIILQSLQIPDGVVRVVFATVALGMGINLKDMNTIIHYGAPKITSRRVAEEGVVVKQCQP